MSEKSPRISIPQPVRTYILQRDRHQCRQCGTSNPLEIDTSSPSLVVAPMLSATTSFEFILIKKQYSYISKSRNSDNCELQPCPFRA